MGHLILTMHVSADGYIARTDRSSWPGFGWPPAVQGRLNDVYREAGVVVCGRGIYEAVVPWWLAVAGGEPPDGTDLIGSGRPLLEGFDARKGLELIEVVAYPPTTSWVRYRVR